MANEFKNKVILVTGGTGTIGSELVRQLLALKPRQIRILSRDDTKQYHLLEELGYPSNVRLLIGDIRDANRLDLAFEGVDIVFHAAALKHVSICEYNPFEAIKTNVVGSQNVIDAALKNNVKKVIAISTDKAANPTNIMGTTKLLMEKLFTNANYYKGSAATTFSCVRFGNVAWARGSVLPLWEKSIANTKSITVTNPNMTRFFMSQQQAIQLILRATELAQGGEIFILKMPSIKLGDLARLFIGKHYKGKDIKINVTKTRIGDKLHEDLMSTANDNYKHIFEDKHMLVLTPDPHVYNLEETTYTYPGFKKLAEQKQYSSKDSIDLKGIEKIV